MSTESARKAAERIQDLFHGCDVVVETAKIQRIIETACQTVAPPPVCPTCSASMSLVYECDNGHEFQGPDVHRIEAGTVGADITMCTADIGKMPVINLGAAPAVSTPPGKQDLRKWSERLARVVMDTADYKDRYARGLMEDRIFEQLRALAAQFFHPAPSPPQESTMVGAIVRVDNPQFAGFGIAEYDTGDRKRCIGVKLENGNTWEYAIETVRLATHHEMPQIPQAVLKLANERSAAPSPQGESK